MPGTQGGAHACTGEVLRNRVCPTAATSLRCRAARDSRALGTRRFSHRGRNGAPRGWYLTLVPKASVSPTLETGLNAPHAFWSAAPDNQCVSDTEDELGSMWERTPPSPAHPQAAGLGPVPPALRARFLCVGLHQRSPSPEVGATQATRTLGCESTCRNAWMSWRESCVAKALIHSITFDPLPMTAPALSSEMQDEQAPSASRCLSSARGLPGPEGKVSRVGREVYSSEWANQFTLSLFIIISFATQTSVDLLLPQPVSHTTEPVFVEHERGCKPHEGTQNSALGRRKGDHRLKGSTEPPQKAQVAEHEGGSVWAGGGQAQDARLEQRISHEQWKLRGVRAQPCQPGTL